MTKENNEHGIDTIESGRDLDEKGKLEAQLTKGNSPGYNFKKVTNIEVYSDIKRMFLSERCNNT